MFILSQIFKPITVQLGNIDCLAVLWFVKGTLCRNTKKNVAQSCTGVAGMPEENQMVSTKAFRIVYYLNDLSLNIKQKKSDNSIIANAKFRIFPPIKKLFVCQSKRGRNLLLRGYHLISSTFAIQISRWIHFSRITKPNPMKMQNLW